MKQTEIGTITTNEMDEITEVTIKLLIPNYAIEKLNYYGWDYVKNINDYIKNTYFAICAAEEADEIEDLTRDEADN